MEKEDYIKKVGTKIRITREKKNLSLETLAFEAGIDYSQLSRIENGKINTSIYNLYVIAAALGVSMSEFL